MPSWSPCGTFRCFSALLTLCRQTWLWTGVPEASTPPSQLHASFFITAQLHLAGALCLQPAAVLSRGTAIPAPAAATKVPSGPNQPRLFRRAVLWDADRKEHTELPDRKADASTKEGLLLIPSMALMIWWPFSSLWKAEQGLKH